MAKTVRRKNALAAELRPAVGEARPLPRRRTGMDSLTSISEAMGADISPKEVLRLIVQSAHGITRANTASLMLIEPGAGVLTVEVAEGFKGDEIYRTRLRVGQGVTGWVAETGVPLRVGNVTKDERYVRVQRGLRSELAVPMKIGGHIIGVISVDSTKLNHFSAEDEALLISLAAHSARVIQSTRLFEETRRRARELELLIEAARVLAGTLDLQQVLSKLADLAARFWKAKVASVFLTSDDGRSLSLAAAQGGTPAYREHPTLSVQGSLLGEILHGPPEARLFEDVEKQLKDPLRRMRLPEDARTLLAAPLVAKSRPLGVLCVYVGSGRKVTSDERRLLTGLASSASLAIENANVHRRMMAAEEALRGAEKSNLMVEMASGLAHEVRNPLTSIKILVDSMVRGQQIAAEAAPDAAMIQKQIDRLEKIVSGYLESARAHASRMEHKPLDFNAVAEESLLLLATGSHEGLRIDCRLHPEELAVSGDATQLSQVVYNLVNNAIQAVADPGRRNGRGRGHIELVSGRNGADVFLEIADDGPGLPAEVRERLYQPFVTTKPQGTGLGLSIVRRIVEAHGGRVAAESPRADLGHGTRFTVTLPCA